MPNVEKSANTAVGILEPLLVDPLALDPLALDPLLLNQLLLVDPLFAAS